MVSILTVLVYLSEGQVRKNVQDWSRHVHLLKKYLYISLDNPVGSISLENLNILDKSSESHEFIKIMVNLRN